MARTIMALLVVMAAGMLVLAGCDKPRTEPDVAAFPPPSGGGSQDPGLTVLPTDGGPDLYQPPVASPPSAADGGTLGSGPYAPAPGQPYDVVQPPPPAPAVRYHVVEKGDNYYRLAIKYYGSGSQANRQKLMDANPQYPERQIPVGARIVVPE